MHNSNKIKIGNLINNMLGSGTYNTIKTPTVKYDDWLSESVNPYVKKHQTYELKEDLITLAVAWKRYRINRSVNDPSTFSVLVSSLLDKSLFEFVNDDDRRMASEIKDYYSKKFMMLKLQGIRFSKYRDDLNSYIHSQGNVVTDEQLPMVYYLPDFYDYDKTFDMLYATHNKEVKQKDIVHVSNTTTLKFLKTFHINRKRIRKIECWFADENNNLVTFITDYNNSLVPLLEQVSKDGLKVLCSTYKRKRDTNEFLEITKLSFL